jgi:hypothetical protein
MKIPLLLLAILVLLCGTLFAQTYPRDQTIVAGEYFLNTDPGVGKGSPLSATYGFAEATSTFDLNIPDGSVVYIRFKSSNGTWSAPTPFVYHLPLPLRGAEIAGGEYFTGADPSAGKGTPISIGPSGAVALDSLKLKRDDIVYLRVKDSFGRWSAATGVRYTYRAIRAAQYYIKQSNGVNTATADMSIVLQTTPSPFYSAMSGVIPSTTNRDTVFVRYQSEDYIWSSWFKTEGTVVSVDDRPTEIPKEYALYQNYPNPFNPTSIIRYDLPKSSFVTLKVYDVLGTEVSTLVNERQEPGVHQMSWQASGFASGVYFYRLQAGSFVETKKLILLR